MIVFARVNPDTPGKLAAHAFSYEHMELAAYELLRRAAERAGDEALVALARRIGGQEKAMAARLAAGFDQAVEASLREKGGGGLNLVAFVPAQPDTPGKLAGFAFAFEHLELAAYELLRRVAQRAGDSVTADAAQRIAEDERDAAQRIAGTWSAAMEAALEKVG